MGWDGTSGVQSERNMSLYGVDSNRSRGVQSGRNRGSCGRYVEKRTFILCVVTETRQDFVSPIESGVSGWSRRVSPFTHSESPPFETGSRCRSLGHVHRLGRVGGDPTYPK